MNRGSVDLQAVQPGVPVRCFNEAPIHESGKSPGPAGSDRGAAGLQ